MIFATDLDRTLIYSHKFLNGIKEEDILLVESLEGKEISFMSRQAVKQLNKLKKFVTIVPVTTRTIKQFQRVKIFAMQKYAIVANGAIILENGKPLQEWNEIVDAMLETYRPLFENIISLLQNQKCIIRKPEVLENAFIFTKTDNANECEHLLLDKLDLKLWNISIQGKKVYILPKEITKENALDFLKDKVLKDNFVISAGDSILDKGMLEYADYAILPKHGTLYGRADLNVKNLIIVDNGIFSADDILRKVEMIAK